MRSAQCRDLNKRTKVRRGLYLAAPTQCRSVLPLDLPSCAFNTYVVYNIYRLYDIDEYTYVFSSKPT